MEAIILAGGFGTRLSHLVSDVPKPMAPVCNRPFLEYILDDLIQQGMTSLILAVGHQYKKIIDHFGYDYHGVRLVYSIEKEPLGTGGAIENAMPHAITSPVFVVNGDTYFPVDLTAMMKKGKELEKPLIAVKKVEDCTRYGAVTFAEDGKITTLSEKNKTGEGFINGGCYLLPNDSFAQDKTFFSLETEIFPNLVANNALFAFESDSFFIDIGVEEDYINAQSIFRDVTRLRE